MTPLYPMWPYLWPAALLLLWTCTPRGIRQWLRVRLQLLGFAIGALLAAPYLITLLTG